MIVTFSCSFTFSFRYAKTQTSNFHKVVRQHTEGMMGSIIWILLEIYFCFQQSNNFENRLRIDNRHEFGILLFGTACILVLLQFYDVMHGWMDTVNNDISSLDPLESSARRQVVACLVQRFTAASLASTLSKVRTVVGGVPADTSNHTVERAWRVRSRAVAAQASIEKSCQVTVSVPISRKR